VRTKTSLQSDKILDAAAGLFGSQRFHEVRMEDVASAADVGKGTIYRYFMDKEELFRALLRRTSEQFLARLEEAVAGEEGARNRLEAVVAGILEVFDAQPHLLDLIQRSEVMQGPGTDFPWQKARDDLFQLVAQLFAEGKQEGAFCLRDPDLGVLMLLGGIRSVIRFGPQPRPRNLARRIVDDFLEGAVISGSWKGRLAKAPLAVP
jgi:AcrR family transcriptional regulator